MFVNLKEQLKIKCSLHNQWSWTFCNFSSKAIKDILSDNQPLPVTIDKILNEVARTYGTSVENILSEKRNANISKARQAAMYIVREITSLPMEKIGEEFGGKHHSTVIYNIRECEKRWRQIHPQKQLFKEL